MSTQPLSFAGLVAVVSWPAASKRGDYIWKASRVSALVPSNTSLERTRERQSAKLKLRRARRSAQSLDGTQVQRHFYALPDDLLVIFELVEASQPMRYTSMESLITAKPKCFLNGAELPSLNRPPPSDSAIAGHRYLVTLRGVEPVGRRINVNDGGIQYAYDQLNNPDSIELLPGARHVSGAILYGRIATCSETPASGRIFGLFKRAIGKRFRKINGFWVGPKAEEAWRKGTRLTIGLASPREYDLREPHADAV